MSPSHLETRILGNYLTNGRGQRGDTCQAVQDELMRTGDFL
jgi:hypothetical protein